MKPDFRTDIGQADRADFVRHLKSLSDIQSNVTGELKGVPENYFR
jgi:hypothetical protein